MNRIVVALVGLIGSCAMTLLPPSVAEASSSTAGVVTTKTATRVSFNADGSSTLEHSYRIKLTVSQTSDLRGRQEIGVSWSGAPATKGVVGDVNSTDGALQEYPFVLMQCRGTAATLSPETCWTQGPGDRYQGGPSRFQAWRQDGFAPWSERSVTTDSTGKVVGGVIGGPAKTPANCHSVDAFARWVPFRGVKATYQGGPAACAGAAPEAGVLGGSAMPSNTTYGITGADGTGSAQFDVWTASENASLGCSATVACSLVAVPIVGISCDDYGTTTGGHETFNAAQTARALQSCNSADSADAYTNPGDPNTGPALNTATTGLLWWSASNWRNRLVVPLNFAPTPDVCSVLNPKAPLQIYGSIALADVTAQWAPTFCTNPAYSPFVHVATSDAAARNLLNAGTITASFSTRGPTGPWGRPIVQAPVALTGFAVTFDIDGRDGTPLTSLKLNARLLAKLLTQSYPAEKWIASGHPGLANNPLNITLDPEFQHLNPQVPATELDDTRSTLLALSSESDLIWALTSYITADPAARAWLNGDPDQWGMTVNPAYKKIALPVESWSLLDGWTPSSSDSALANDPCFALSPEPYLNLIANPQSSINSIEQNLQFSISNVGNRCSTDGVQPRYVTNGRQVAGHRFVIGVVPLTAVGRYSLTPAALQTSENSFVLPDEGGLKAAIGLLKPAAGLWSLDYPRIAKTANAYPGTMPVYADVPTKGLSPAVAATAAQFVRFAADAGQVPGTSNGRLAAGALPLTAANGAAALHAYALCAATAIQAQKGVVPAIGASCATSGTPTVTTGAGGSVPVVAAPPSAPVPPAGSAPAAVALSYSRYHTVGAITGLGRWGIPVAVGLVVALVGFASASRWGPLVVAQRGAVIAALRRVGRRRR